MAEHRFDPVALVFGGLAIAAGSIVLTGGELTDEGRVLVPGGLIAAGCAVLVNVLRRDPAVPTAVGSPSVLPGVDPDDSDAGSDHSDLDDLFAPVDEVLTSWPSDPARMATDTARPAGTDGDPHRDEGHRTADRTHAEVPDPEVPDADGTAHTVARDPASESTDGGEPSGP